MEEERKILKKNMSGLAGIMNAVPGEIYRCKECETLLILQRRMNKSDLKKELTSFNEVFAKMHGALKDDLSKSAVSYVRIRVLLEQDEDDFNARSIRILVKEFKNQMVKTRNIIHLSKANAAAAEEYQKEKIQLTIEKNEAFLEAFENEVKSLELQMERVPKEKSVFKEEAENLKQKKKPDSGFKIVDHFFDKGKRKKEIEEQLKTAEKKKSLTECEEIPFYDKSLISSDALICHDMKEYLIVKRKNNIFFGKANNLKKNIYDNADQSLMELTNASEEFVQFMTEDLLSGDYELSAFSEEEKEGLVMYFNFVTRCFQNQIGVTLSVREYLQFKGYYNRLVQKMFDLEEKQRADYYKALVLMEQYRKYMRFYELECQDSDEEMIENLIAERNEAYAEYLDLILENHIMDEDAGVKISELKNKILNFHRIENQDESCEAEVAESVISEVISAPEQSNMQIVIQFLNANREIIDEAQYAGNNLRQALCDYAAKEASIKRLGLRSRGEDLIFREEVKEG